MKQNLRTNFALLLVLLILIGGIWLRWPAPSQSGSVQRNKSQRESSQSGQSSRDLGTAHEFRDEGPVSANPAKADQRPEDRKTELAAVMRVAVAEKNASINFWGMITDQYNAPISNVRIVLRVRQWAYDPIKGVRTASPKLEVRSDSNGRFELREQSGDVLTLDSVEKEGYVLSLGFKNSMRFREPVDPNLPTEQAPMVIKMWKTGAKEITVSNRGFFGVVPDGRSYFIDLLLSQKNEGANPVGDIQLKLTRLAEVKGSERYRWQFELGGIGGGIIEATDDFMFMAPESGYVTNRVFEMDPTLADWTTVLKKNFYFRSRGGTAFGVAKMTIRPDYNGKGAVQIESVINTNSSRNLQP